MFDRALLRSLLFVALLCAATARGAIAGPAQGQDQLIDKSVGALGTHTTVVLVLSPNCQACIEAIPFYVELQRLPKMDGVTKRIVALAQDGVVPLRRALQSRSFHPDVVSSGPRAAQMVETLPTIVILDANGTRVGTWAGPLTDSQKSEVIAAVKK